MATLEESIKDYARGLGFDIVGITTAEPFLRDERAATQRVRDGLMDGLPLVHGGARTPGQPPRASPA